jgi:hypothetical protein
MDELPALLARLTRDELLESAKSSGLMVPRKDRVKASLIEFLLDNSPAIALEALENHARSKMSGKKKRKRVTKQTDERRIHQRVGWGEDSSARRNIDNYLKLPSDDDVRQCHLRFIEATSNKALQTNICAVCARETDHVSRTEKWLSMTISSLPNQQRLRPSTPHPAQVLTDEMLLETKALHTKNGERWCTICTRCHNELKNEKRGNLPPKLSLANDLWIGDIPIELSSLSFAEQLLLSLVYPRVFVFKLFPRKGGGGRKAETLQRAMRGNVSSYELDQAGIIKMIEGNLMPRPTEVLASVITITFAGLGELPKNWLYNTFRVRRPLLARALHWCKANNTKYFGHIEISEERLSALPEDAVPNEILDIVRQTEDEGVVDQEEGGYVPREEDTEMRQREYAQFVFVMLGTKYEPSRSE